MIKKILLLLLLGSHLQAQDTTRINLTKLYIATFDRAPDAAGLQYWLDSGWSIESIATSFFEQKETKAKYPEGFTQAQFVHTIYQNLFKRNSDSQGFLYWNKSLIEGDTTRSLFILAVMNGALGDDAKILTNKTIVGLAFASSNRNDIGEAKEIMTAITSELTSVEEVLIGHTLTEYKPTDDVEDNPSEETTQSVSNKEDLDTENESDDTEKTNSTPIANGQQVTVTENSQSNRITSAILTLLHHHKFL